MGNAGLLPTYPMIPHIPRPLPSGDAGCAPQVVETNEHVFVVAEPLVNIIGTPSVRSK
jgi:hypothetical protein